jgi:hypothetical protein
MNLDDTVAEMMNRKNRAESEVVSVMWANPHYWCPRARERGIWPGVFDCWSHRAAVVVAEYRAEKLIGHMPAENLLTKLLGHLGLEWDGVALCHTIWKYSAGEAAKLGEMALDELVDSATKMQAVRKAYADIAKATDWRAAG